MGTIGSHEVQFPWTSIPLKCPFADISVLPVYSPVYSFLGRGLWGPNSPGRYPQCLYSRIVPLGSILEPKNFSPREIKLRPCVWPSFLDVLLGLGPMLWAPALLGEALNISKGLGPSILKTRLYPHFVEVQGHCAGHSAILTAPSFPLKRFLGKPGTDLALRL